MFSQSRRIPRSILRSALFGVALILTAANTGYAGTPYDADFAVLRSHDSSYQAIRDAADHLKNSHDPVVIEFWFNILSSDAPGSSQSKAEEALSGLAATHALPANASTRLLENVGRASQSTYPARASARVLTSMIRAGDTTLVPQITRTLDARGVSLDAQVHLVSILSEARDVRSVDTLIRISETNYDRLKEEAIQALGQVAERSPAARARLRAIAADERAPSTQRRAIRALSELKYSRAESWLNAPDVKETLKTLAARLDDADVRVREVAAESLIDILDQLVRKQRATSRELSQVAGCFSSNLPQLMGAEAQQQADGRTLMMFDVLFFGGAPVMSLSQGVKERRAVVEQLNESVKQPWSALEVAELQTLLESI